MEKKYGTMKKTMVLYGKSYGTMEKTMVLWMEL